MKRKESSSIYNSLSSLKSSKISSPEASVITTSNYTTCYYEDRPSHNISQLSSNSSDIFDIDSLKTYEKPSDFVPIPKLNPREIQNLQQKFSDFKAEKPAQVSPRPIIKSPLSRQKSFERGNTSPLVPIQSKSSYKKPLLTIQTEIFNKNISEEVFAGDTSQEIAKRILLKSGIQTSQNGLKNAADLIEKAVTDYISSVSLEIAKFEKNSKKIQQEKSKQKLEKIKPPLLATERRAEEKKNVIGSVNINVKGEEIVVPVKEGDLPDKLAEKVCAEKGLPKDLFNSVRQPIKDFIERNDNKFLFRLEFDIGGKVAEVAVYENDNLANVSQKFVRENKIGRENVSKIEEILKKQMKSLNL